MNVINFKEAAEKHAKEAKENIVGAKPAKVVQFSRIKARAEVDKLCKTMEEWLEDLMVD